MSCLFRDCNNVFTVGVDYVSTSESLVFPNGSVKGCCNHCFNITINDDLLIEDTEVFNIRVQVTEGTRFGGAQNRSIGQVAVKIHDDDGRVTNICLYVQFDSMYFSSNSVLYSSSSLCEPMPAKI